MTYTIKNEKISVSADEFGAQLVSILGADGTEYLWQGDERYWTNRAPNLFPYVARLYGGKYMLDGREYSMKIHGFAKLFPFSCEMLSDTAMEMTLTDNAETLAQYPRHFCFKVRYEVEENVLKISFIVENRDEKTMYFGLGGHPGFNVPLAPGTRFEDYRLRFGEKCSPQRVLFSDDCFVTGINDAYELEDNSIHLRHDLFDNDAVVLKNMAKSVTIECEGDSRSVTVSYPGMKYVGFWHAVKTDAPYVCVEPWCSLPSNLGETTVFEEKSDIIKLPSGETYVNEWTIAIN